MTTHKQMHHMAKKSQFNPIELLAVLARGLRKSNLNATDFLEADQSIGLSVAAINCQLYKLTFSGTSLLSSHLDK